MEYIGSFKPVNTIQPKVSVSIVTYNHKDFIEKCLDSVLAQKTNFQFEIILGEDDSNDGTRKICKLYAERNTDRIRLFLRSEKDKIYINGKKSGRFNFLENLKESRGKYIALCDGDDYWTDPFKLQKQVDFLEANEAFVACFHNVYKKFDDGNQQLFRKYYGKDIYELKDLLGPWLVPTCSIMFRNKVIQLPRWVSNVNNGDLALFLNLAKYGKFKLIDEVMGVYRIHANGITTSFNRAKTLLNVIYIFKNIDIETNGIYQNDIENSIDAFVTDNYKRKIIRDVFESEEKINFLNQFFTFKELISILVFKVKNQIKGSVKL